MRKCVKMVKYRRPSEMWNWANICGNPKCQNGQILEAIWSVKLSKYRRRQLWCVSRENACIWQLSSSHQHLHYNLQHQYHDYYDFTQDQYLSLLSNSEWSRTSMFNINSHELSVPQDIILLNYCLDCFQRLILHLNILLHEHFQVKQLLVKYWRKTKKSRYHFLEQNIKSVNSLIFKSSPGS